MNTVVQWEQVVRKKKGWLGRRYEAFWFFRTFMLTMNDEDYFRVHSSEWGLFSFLKWKKAEGLKLEGKTREHHKYVKCLVDLSSSRAKDALERFQVTSGR